MAKSSTKERDDTKEVLEQLLSDLHKAQSAETGTWGNSYLIAEDGQFLGKITSNQFDRDSISNPYGPYGSKYSTTSIFNEYSPYGSQYGQQSINNPYVAAPPKLYINGRLLGRVTVNPHVHNRIPTESFLYTLENHLDDLLAGRLIENESEARKRRGESFIEAADGTFLGSLKPNQFDALSIFSQFGPHGNKFSPQSIFNPYATYGNKFSNLSPYNEYSQTPPAVFKDGREVAKLTKNKFIMPRIDPDDILAWAESNIRKY